MQVTLAGNRKCPPTNGGKLGKGGLRCKCRWGKEERKSGKWHEINIPVQVHKQESVIFR